MAESANSSAATAIATSTTTTTSCGITPKAVWNECLSYFRSCLIAAVCAWFVYPYYTGTVNWLTARGWGDRGTFTLLSCVVHTGLYILQNSLTLIASQPGGFLNRFQIPRKASHVPPTEVQSTRLLIVIRCLNYHTLLTSYIL
jgi:hypothetical protein